MAIRYYDLMPTTDTFAFCLRCSEYKGMVDCTACGSTFCIFCAESCPGCGESITFAVI